MTPGAQVTEILCSFVVEPPKPGKPALPERFVGRLPDDQFVLLEKRPSGVVEQIGKAVSFEEGLTIASAALDRDPRALTSPNALHLISLTLIGAAWSRQAAVAEAEKTASAKAAEAEKRADEIRAAKAGEPGRAGK